MGERRQAIELHDATLASVYYMTGSHRPNDIALYFGAIFVHESEGEPMVDPGIGWYQRGELYVRDGTINVVGPNLPMEVYGGESSVDGVVRRNALPLPFVCESHFTLDLEGTDDEGLPLTLLIGGSGATLTLLGERPEEVETFPGSTRRRETSG